MLPSGTRLGPYEITAPLGAGGMGEVYRARDTRLGRDVAVKVLPAHLAEHPEVRARFEREARTISGLNHPHICVLHDVGRENGTDFLVMELVDGETLAERIARGPLPLSEVLRIGGQIAGALGRAHRAGVVHRDLKPGNVMLTRSGAKLMDFGLARPTGLAPAAGLTQSPTVSRPLTAEGTIVGTFQYMAPEQLEGSEADARSDLWALGCVLYEMTTGKRPFEGASQASLIGAIMHAEPRPLTELAPLSPPAFDRLVRQCLAKHPDDRWQSAGDLKHELEWIARGDERATGTASAPLTRRTTWIAASLLVTTAMLILLAPRALRPRGDAPAIEAALVPPAGVELSSSVFRPLPLAISPDGSRIVFCGHERNGMDRLWVRALGSGQALGLPGTERAQGPFFSPDGRSIGFFSGGKLRRIDVDGGLVTVLADAPDPRGGSWTRDDRILFTPGSQTPLYAVPAEGGTAVAVTMLDSGEVSHRYAHALPDGRHFLYLSRRGGGSSGGQAQIRVGDLRSRSTRRILDAASNVVYAAGHLLYVRQGTLVAHPFDMRRLAVRGRPVPLLDEVRFEERFSRGAFAASANGMLVTMTGRSESRTQLRWMSREGRPGPTVGEPADYAFGGVPSISPDGTRSAIAIHDPERGNSDIWIVDLATGQRRRLTVGEHDYFAAAWSADGREVVVVYLFGGARLFRLAVRRADGVGGERPLLESKERGLLLPLSAAPDGRHLLYLSSETDSAGTPRATVSPWSATDLMTVPWSGGPPQTFLGGRGDQTVGEFSPDGRHVVYDSNESGRSEIYVAPFPPTGARWQVSQDGGSSPRWSADGGEIFHVDTANRLVAVSVTRSRDALSFGAGRPLFPLPPHGTTTWMYDVAADGRFLVVEPAAGGASSPITLLTNWTARARP